jgi:peptide/nickel transport system substrate-binding protein
MTILWPGDERALGPYWDMSGQFLVFLPLFELGADGQIVGKLAERWEHSPDWRQWTFHLRPDVRWHDGVPVTTTDIEFTLGARATMSPTTAGGGIVTIEVHDERSVTVTYAEPHDARDNWEVYWPAHLLSDVDPQQLLQAEFWTEPVGNGPFRYVRHVPKTMTEFEANPDYYRGRPDLDRVILKYGTGPQVLPELLGGNVDGIGFVERPSLHKLVGDERYQALFGRSEWMLAAYFRLDEPPLDDVRVRRALILGLDRSAVAELLELPAGTVTADSIRPHQPIEPSEPPVPYPYAPDRARALLEEAGWRDIDGDGIREKDGGALRLRAQVDRVSFESSALTSVAVLAQAQWRELGIDLRLSGEGIWRDLEAGRLGGITFHRFFDWVGYHRRFFGANSVIGFDAPQLQADIDRAYLELTPLERGELFADLMPKFQELAPILFLAPEMHTYVVDARYGGLSSPDRADPIRYAEYVTVRGLE